MTVYKAALAGRRIVRPPPGFISHHSRELMVYSSSTPLLP